MLGVYFLVLSMPFYPIILDMPWLVWHDLMVRWARRQIYLPAIEVGAAAALPSPAAAGGVHQALAAVVGQGSRLALVPAGCPVPAASTSPSWPFGGTAARI